MNLISPLVIGLVALAFAAAPLAAQESTVPAAVNAPAADAAPPVPDAVPEASQAEPDADATQAPVLLAPVDRWREDPKVALQSVDIELDEFLWVARPVVIFADTPADPAFQRQIDLLAARADDLVARDVVVITDTDPAALSDLRRKLRPRGFMLAILGKDGGVKLRKPFPWDVREITRSIDKMPLRRQELRERQNANQ